MKNLDGTQKLFVIFWLGVFITLNITIIMDAFK